MKFICRYNNGFNITVGKVYDATFNIYTNNISLLDDNGVKRNFARKTLSGSKEIIWFEDITEIRNKKIDYLLK